MKLPAIKAQLTYSFYLCYFDLFAILLSLHQKV